MTPAGKHPGKFRPSFPGPFISGCRGSNGRNPLRGDCLPYPRFGSLNSSLRGEICQVIKTIDSLFYKTTTTRGPVQEFIAVFLDSDDRSVWLYNLYGVRISLLSIGSLGETEKHSRKQQHYN
jgi:hypothetical protein